jgi:hypothetical protein
LASLFIGHAAQKSKLDNLQYDEGDNHMGHDPCLVMECQLNHWSGYLGMLYCQFKIVDF